MYGIIAVLLIQALCLSGQTSAAPTTDLDRLKRDFLRILHERRTDNFLAYVSNRGVAFGVDSDFEKKKAIATDFQKKRGAYCVLFDSRCLNEDSKQTNELRPCSAYELLNTPDATVTISLQTPGGQPTAFLGIKSQAGSCLGGTQSYEFIFTRSRGGWKLIAVEYT